MNAFDADVTVTVCAAVASDTDAYGTWRRAVVHERRVHLVGDDPRAVPLDDRRQRESARRRVNTRPVGLCGLHSRTARAPARERGVDRVEVERVGGRRSARSGTATDRPAGELHDLEERRVRRASAPRRGAPGATCRSSAAPIPVSTSAIGKIRAGATSQPYRAAKNVGRRRR